MIYGPVFHANKVSGTFSDTLAAYGLAKMLEGILVNGGGLQTSRKIVIRDAGPYYTVELDKPIPDEWVERCPFFSLARPIKTPKQPCEGLLEPWILDDEWERSRQYRDAAEAFRQSVKSGKATDTDAELALSGLKPGPDFDVLTLLSDTMMQALKAYNRAVARWHQTREFFTVNLKTILEMSASPEVDWGTIAESWSKSVPKVDNDLIASQLFNPSQGQGQNHPKANLLDTRRNLYQFWLVEYLKAVGIWTCAAPRKVYDKNKSYAEQDRKTYVLMPCSLSLGLHGSVFRKFSERLWSRTPVKMDIEATLLYTETLLEHSETTDGADELVFEGFGPEDVVAGLQIAHYKPLNRRSYTMLSLSFIGLPHWTGEVRTHARIQELKEVIREHLRVLRAIDESHSDGYMLLERYRDFLSGRQIGAFFDFAVGYSRYLISQWNQANFRPTQFTTQNLRRLFMGNEPRFSEIIENEGFQAIAAAIRGSTVTPQYQMARFKQGQGEKPLYEVRYGLGQELKRKAAYKQEFITALSDFLQTYNQENVQKAESQKSQQRKNVRTGDIEDIVRLVDKFGSEVVCNLLVAFGYARDPRGPED